MSGRVEFGYRAVVLRRPGFAQRWRARTVVVCATAAVLTTALLLVALMLGDYPLTPGQVWAALTGAPEAGFARTVVVEWRAPRAIAAIVFGAALGASGAMFQSLTRNPLASPDIIGVSAGSYTAVLVVIILIHGSYLQLVAGAILGGVATAAVIYLLAWRRGVHGFRLIVVGIAISAMLASVNTWLMATAKLEVAMSAEAWGAGSLAGTGWGHVLWGGLIVASLLLAATTLGPGLRQLEMGDDAARATGTKVESTRLQGMLLGVVIVAVVTAASGPISFIALAAPQIARRLARTPGVTIAPAVCLGALMLIAADLVAQHVVPVPLPVGVVTVVIGGAYLIRLIAREARRRD